MMNAGFREWEFVVMGNYFYEHRQIPVEQYFPCIDRCKSCDRFRCQYYPHLDCIIVYLEDFKINGNHRYTLLLDFFTLSDYYRFLSYFEYGYSSENKNNDGIDRIVPRSTFFTINNYVTQDEPIKGAHYYLNLMELRELSPNKAMRGLDGFPLLCSFDLSHNAEKKRQKYDRLLYLTTSLTYPQFIFKSFDKLNKLATIGDKKVDLLIWNVGQGNCNEIRVGGEEGKPYVIFDAGTHVLGETKSFSIFQKMLKERLSKEGLPLFVLSHWHTDHYSLLFAQNESELKSIRSYVMPSYVKNLSVYLFIAKLNLIGVNLYMVKLPSSSKWEDEKINGNVMLYANKYVFSNLNDSGLTLFVKGPLNNVIMPGDCKYTNVEGQANEAIDKLNAVNRDLKLVIPHHGGNAGKNVTFKVPSAVAVDGYISVGKKNSYKHPTKAVVAVLKGVLRSVKMTKYVKDRAKGKEYIKVRI